MSVLVGDCLDVLSGMPAGSVHCCVTSPPYFGLRDYGTGEWEGGDSACDHRRLAYPRDRETPGGRGGSMPMSEHPFRDVCGKCGATRVDKQIGLEPTPDEYVARLVGVFGEVKRVLRGDGTLWLNLGDSYAGSWGARSRGGPPSESSTLEGNGHRGGGPKIKSMSAVQIAAHPRATKTDTVPAGSPFKAKDLLGIPWMVAFALRADGWFLRSEIIWAKPNPMPESVTDRPTKAHEQVFLLSKSPRYFYDAAAVAEPLAEANAQRTTAHYSTEHYGAGNGGNGGLDSLAARMRDGSVTGRNKRSVWTVSTMPYPDAHFATFPPKLIEPMILAGCPRGGTVLDPFAGSGTTLQVALANGREAVGIELNPEYAAMAERRLAGVTSSMFDVGEAA